DVFCGTITNYFADADGDGTPLWHVQYDDGDREDLYLEEVMAAIALYQDFREKSTPCKRRRVAAKSCSSDTAHISSPATHKRPSPIAARALAALERDISDSSDDESGDDEMRCIMCAAHGRKPDISLNNPAQLLPVRLKPRTGKGAGKRTVAHIHASCALRAPPSSSLKGQAAPKWWEEVAEKTNGWPNLSPARSDSTSPEFVPFPMSFSDWVDELALYDYRKLLASVRRFDEGRAPPYNSVGGTAALWRCDDRGSIGYCRMAPNLVEKAGEMSLSPAEAALWGSIAYRCFNRLSTFSRWAAVKALAAKLNLPVSEILARQSGSTSLYEERCHGPPGVRSEEFHAIAASGVTLHGRHGYRDKWGKEFCAEQMNGKRTPMCCVAEIPLPSEIGDFKTFVKWESRQGRGVMTGEHQVQPKERILAMLSRLAAKDCERLRNMSALFWRAHVVETILDDLRTLDTVGPFFAWQIFSDLVAIQYGHCQLFPDSTILPTWAVQGSLFDYALFGPGARKGAYIIDGGASTVLETDKDTSQAVALERAKRILAEFGTALKRTGVDKNWNECARGRPYDLETLEHSLCGFYGVLVDHCTNVIEADEKSSDAMAKVAMKANCAWPPEASGPSHSASTREKQGGPAWAPNPCTALERADLERMESPSPGLLAVDIGMAPANGAKETRQSLTAGESSSDCAHEEEGHIVGAAGLFERWRTKTQVYQSMNFAGGNGEPPATGGDDDPNKWERMYYAPAQQQSANEQFSSLASAASAINEVDDPQTSPTASEIRVVTFDLDNTVWKTGATISDANDALATHLMEAFGVEERSEKRMGKLFKQFSDRYAGIDFAEGNSIDSGKGAAEDGRDYSDLVQYVGQSEIEIPAAANGDSGVHIQASFGSEQGGQMKKKPVYLTLLRKDAVRSLLQECVDATTASPLELEDEVDRAFEVWMEARCQSISRNFAPCAVQTLTNLRSQLQPDDASQKVYIGAITDGNSNPDRVAELSGVFDFLIRAEDVGASKPDPRVYKAAVAALMVQLEKDGRGVEEFFLGDLDEDIATGSYIQSDLVSGQPAWKNVDPEAVSAFSEAVHGWWVHVGDDFFKDVVAAKEMQMRTVWTRELIVNDEEGKSATKSTKSEEKKRSVTDLVNDIANSDGALKMSIGETEFLSNSLHDEFSDAILGRFRDLGSLLIKWHEEGKEARSDDDSAPSGTDAPLETSIANANIDDLVASRRGEEAMGGSNKRKAGTALDVSTSHKFCVFCGGQLPAVAQFCSHCGEKQT
ncbi:hypothetical protein ACHAXT_005162, partial [Thalassiosira profunda]